MKTLIIGGSGNISNEITKIMLSKGYDVSVVNRGIRKTYEGVTNIVCDVKDYEKFTNLMKDKQYDCVIDMLSYKEEDVRFTYDLFKDKTKHLIVCSTSAVYRRPMISCPVKVSDPILTENTYEYGYNKACIERFLQSKMHETNITIIRPSLTFGEGAKNIGFLRQNYNIIHRILNKMPLISFGDGLNPFTFSSSYDVANAFVLCALNENTYSKTYTITCGDFHYIDDLYNTFAKLLNEEAIIYHLPTELLVDYNTTFNHLYFEKRHIAYYTLDEFIKDVPEYKPVFTLDKTVQLLIDDFNKEKYVDQALMDMEDDLVNRYKECQAIMKRK